MCEIPLPPPDMRLNNNFLISFWHAVVIYACIIVYARVLIAIIDVLPHESHVIDDGFLGFFCINVYHLFLALQQDNWNIIVYTGIV